MEQLFGIETVDRGYLIRMCNTREAAVMIAEALCKATYFPGPWSNVYKIVPYEWKLVRKGVAA